ncbi:TauD/TfdA dioxygenase family protein [Streptomyces lasalocidi]
MRPRGVRAVPGEAGAPRLRRPGARGPGPDVPGGHHGAARHGGGVPVRNAAHPGAAARDRQFAVPDRRHTDARRRAPEREQGQLHRAGVSASPGRGGETLIAGSRAFFATAPAALVETLRGIRIEYWSRVSGFYVERPEGNPVVAPVQVDPVTGGDTLWVGLDHPEDPQRNYGAAVVGCTKEQSSALFAELARWLSVPEVMYAHRWQVGQVLVMDNRRVVHARAAYSADAPRKLRRISVG